MNDDTPDADASDADDRAIARALGLDTGDAGPDADEALVGSYLEVLAELPLTEVPPRPELEDRVMAAALARRPAATPTLESARARRARRGRILVLVAAAAAAAVVVGFIVSSHGSTAVPGGRVNVAPSANRTDDVAAWVAQLGARTGAFANPPAHVVLTADGNGAIYDLPASAGPYVIGLVSDGHVTRLDAATASNGIIEFTVRRPDLVSAVTLERDGREIARAQLSAQ